jgi:hypothetical protein
MIRERASAKRSTGWSKRPVRGTGSKSAKMAWCAFTNSKSLGIESFSREPSRGFSRTLSPNLGLFGLFASR